MATATAAAAPGAAPAEDPPYPQAPVIAVPMALVVLVVNIFVPGIGTIVGGVLGEKPLIGRGVAQFLLSFIIVGWIWALVTSVQTLQNATWAEKRGIV